jgi:diadenosine tetraphosphate (Ap4A) HIT family hydrolase
MPETLTQRLAKTNLDQMSEREMRALLGAIIDGVRALAAKLDADAANTALNDTNYAATFDNFVTR